MNWKSQYKGLDYSTKMSCMFFLKLKITWLLVGKLLWPAFLPLFLKLLHTFILLNKWSTSWQFRLQFGLHSYKSSETESYYKTTKFYIFSFGLDVFVSGLPNLPNALGFHNGVYDTKQKLIKVSFSSFSC